MRDLEPVLISERVELSVCGLCIRVAGPRCLDQVAEATADRVDDLLDIDAALEKLALADSQAPELVKLRCFAGLTNAQAAEVLGISPRNADFLWAYARAWLLRSLGGSNDQS